MKRRDLWPLGLGAALGLSHVAARRTTLPAAQAKSPEDANASAACRPQDPLQALMDGNARFAALERAYGRAQSPAARQRLLAEYWQDNCHVGAADLAQSQMPWAGIITCADSRVPPSWIFDTNPGQLFVVRSAGNTAFDEGVASMEYAVANLGTPLILVLGHSSCGAVSAALDQKPLTPLLTRLVQPIRAALPQGMDNLEQAVEGNTKAAAAELIRKSSLLAAAVASGSLTVRSAVFDIRTSLVRLL